MPNKISTRRLLAIALTLTFAVPAAAQLCPLQPQPALGSPGALYPILDSTEWDPDGTGPLPARPLVLGGNYIGGWSAGMLAVAQGDQWRPPIGTTPLWIGPNDASRVCGFRGELYLATRGGGISTWNGSSYVLVAGTGEEGTSINRLHVEDDRLIAVGRFDGINRILQPGNQLGPRVSARGIVVFDGAQWQGLGTGLTGTVRAAKSFGGELLAAQDLRVKAWNGSTWRDFGAQLPGLIYELQILGGQLYAAGRRNDETGWVSRWDGTAWTALPDPPGWVVAVVEHQGSIYAGGKRPSSGRAYIARWNGSAWDLLAVAPRGPANSLGFINSVSTLRSDGDRLLIGGAFGDLGGLTGDNIVAYQNGQFRPLGDGFNSSIDSLASIGDTVFAAGGFSQLGSTPLSGLAVRDAAGWRAVPPGGPSFVRRLLADAGTLYAVSGSTSEARIWALNGTTWSPIAPAPSPGQTSAFAKIGNDLVLASYVNPFTEFFTTTIDLWNGSTWTRVAELPRTSVGPITEFNGFLVARRSRDFGSGAWSRDVAAWDGSAWNVLATFDADPRALTVYDGDLFVSGSFTQVNGNPLQGIARFNGTTWFAATGGLPASNDYAVFTVNGQLFASSSLFGLHRWNGSAWEPATGPDERGFFAAAAYGNNLVFASSFSASTTGASYVREFVSPLPAQILAQPAPATLCPGSIATLRVTAAAQGTLTYRWRKDRTPLVDGPAPSGSGATVSGSATFELRITGASAADSAAYDCVVTTDCGLRTFTIQARVIIGTTDANGDSVRSPADIAAFLTWYFASDARADFNRDGRRSPADIFSFLTAYFSGC